MNERQIAYKCLCDIIISGQYSNIALRNNENTSPFVTQLVYGTLRNYRLVNEVWGKYVDKKPPKVIGVLLAMAVYELHFLDTPKYACVNEAVEIAKQIKKGSYEKMINAILHKIKNDDFLNNDLSIMTSHPTWLLDLWTAHYGKEICEKICFSNIKEPRIALRVNTLLTTQQQMLAEFGFTKGHLDNSLYFSGNIIETDYYKSNKVVIQSESSQYAINQLDLHEKMNVLDLCAAPGSKSLQMAMLLNNKGHIVANDIYDFRVNLIEKNIARYGITNVETSVCDGLKIDQKYEKGSFDIVVLDAPCSGLGTLRHKPEIKINITPEDLDDIISLQYQLLIVADKMLKDGGTLLYSTCTLNKKENEKQIVRFIKEHPNYEIINERTIFPFDYDSDGFYVCKIVKKNVVQ